MSLPRAGDVRVGGRHLERLGLELSERDLAVVRTVATCRLASSRQLERLHFEASSDLSRARTSRRVLRRLADARLLTRLERRVGGIRAGSAGQVYGLGPVGHRLLADQATRAGSGARPRLREPSPTFLHHTLAITELLVEVTEGCQPSGARLVGLEAEPACWRPFATSFGIQHLRPDLGLDLRLGDGDELHWFVEVDRGTEHLPAVMRKGRQYLAYYQAGIEQAGLDGLFPAVLFSCIDQPRAKKLRAGLHLLPGVPEGLFTVVSAEQAAAVLLAGAP